MFIFIYIASFCLLLVGLVLIYTKYRVVIGGTLCEGEFVRCEYGASSFNVSAYNYIVGFTYNGNYIEKRSINNTITPRNHIGRKVLIYYNAKHPKYVANKSIEMDVLASCVIVLGLLGLLALHVWY